MADDKEPETGEDPWAGLESEQLPDLNEGFAFSFEESADSDAASSDEPSAVDAAAGESPVAKSEAGTDDEDVNEWLEEPENGSAAPELSVFQSDDEEGEGDSDLWKPEASGPSSIDIAAEHSGVVATSEPQPEPLVASTASEATADFGGDDSFAAAMAAEMLAGDSPEESAVAAESGAEADNDMFEPGGEAGESSEDSAGNAGGMFHFTESMESESSEGEAGEASEESPTADAFSFTGMGGGGDEEDGAIAATGDGDESTFGESIDIGEAMGEAPMAEASSEAGKKPAKTKRPAPVKKKKPSMVGQMIGMVVGGAMSIPIVLAILWWGVGKDPLKVAPMVPDWLAFILPSKLQTGTQRGATAGGSAAPSLDDVVADGGSETPAPDVAPSDLGISDEPAPDVPAPESVEPPATDVVAIDVLPETGGEAGDPVSENPGAEDPPSTDPSPPPAPAPEPLDTAALQAAADRAIAAMAAVEGVDDPTDPVHKKVLVECYKALASYAQELAMLERVATDTGRVLEAEAMPAPVATVSDAINGRPEMHGVLARLARDWLAYSRRTSDGVVAPVTFVASKQVGPYWRSEVTVGEKPLVILTRAQPTAGQGDVLLVTGVTVDKDVVWATDVRPAKAADLFGL